MLLSCFYCLVLDSQEELPHCCLSLSCFKYKGRCDFFLRFYFSFNYMYMCVSEYQFVLVNVVYPETSKGIESAGTGVK